MTLRDFMICLTNANLNVGLSDENGDLITFVSGGYASVESDLLDRKVKKWSVNSSTSISIVLKDTETTP